MLTKCIKYQWFLCKRVAYKKCITFEDDLSHWKVAGAVSGVEQMFASKSFRSDAAPLRLASFFVVPEPLASKLQTETCLYKTHYTENTHSVCSLHYNSAEVILVNAPHYKYSNLDKYFPFMVSWFFTKLETRNSPNHRTKLLKIVFPSL